MRSSRRSGDREFYLKRAEDERQRAANCKDRHIGAIHLELAAKYDELAAHSDDEVYTDDPTDESGEAGDTTSDG